MKSMKFMEIFCPLSSRSSVSNHKIQTNAQPNKAISRSFMNSMLFMVENPLDKKIY